MKRVKTKHHNSGIRKEVRRAADEAVGYMLPLCYVAMKDEFKLTTEQIRAWKERVDRYSDYISQGLISFEDIKKDLREAGFNL